MNLDGTCTQKDFAELIGVSQQAVSEMLSVGVLRAGSPVREWLLSYTGNLREQAAGRGADGELAFQRSELSRVNRERAEIKLAVERKEYAAVSVLEQVLAHVGKSVAGALEPLHINLHKLCPALTPEDIKLIQSEVSKACDVAVGASLAVLDIEEDVGAEPLDEQLDEADVH